MNGTMNTERITRTTYREGRATEVWEATERRKARKGERRATAGYRAYMLARRAEEAAED